MTAGAPGASGSLVIFSSSGEMGWKPTPARTVAGGYSAAARSRNTTQEAKVTTRRNSTDNLPELLPKPKRGPRTFGDGHTIARCLPSQYHFCSPLGRQH